MDRDSQAGASERIAAEVTSWPGVTSGPHRFGGLEFRLGRRELGHLHGDRLADLPFPKRVRDRLIEEGRARPHHVLPDSGWVSVQMRSEADVEEVVGLFRDAFERAQAQAERRSTRSG
jgi:luciferase-like monooxygenase